MSISFGGLGIMSIHRSLDEWSDIVQGKGEVRSLFFALLVSVVVVVLAYLTNPSENSFRTFLTEQSFRQHLSRLDYTNDEDQSDPEENIRDAYSLRSLRSSNGTISNKGNNNDHTTRGSGIAAATAGPPFHFANRASVSLRTPKHVFHSFGVCTIAAVIPLPTAGAGHGCSDHDGSSTILDSWFIGAFGKWWRAGVIEAWYRDLASRGKDEEGWSSGILGFKALDKFSEYNSFSFSKAVPQARQPVRGSPPKLRNRERSTARGLPPRSSTPPPLPKSASLPLHTTRLPSTPEHRHAQATAHSIQGQPVMPTTSASGSPAVSRSSSAMLEQSPIIAEVLRQISAAKSTVHDLRTQLNEFQSASSESHSSLQTEVDSYRERKKHEEASRLELKSRTKALEDSKRHAEGHKRDAEKRLKSAQNARDDCTHRMEHLDQEIARLQQRSVDDDAAIEQCKVNTAQAEQEISDALELKKQEIKVAEEVIAALSLRAKDLEEKLAGEKERLRQARERAEIRKRDRLSFYSPLHVEANSNSTWSPIPFGPQENPQSEHHDIDNGQLQQGNGNEHRDLSRSPVPRPGRLSLSGISNFNNGNDHGALRAKGYSIFDEDIASLQSQHTTNFSPFDDTDTSPVHTQSHNGHLITPTSSSLIPTGLMSVMDNSSESLTRSFQSDNDAYLDKDWRGRRKMHSPPVENIMSTSPISMTGPSFNEYDPFEVRQPEGMRSDSMNMQRAVMPMPPVRTHSDPTLTGPMEESVGTDKSGPRRWFSTSNKPKKGLNPDAKVFQLTKTPDFGAIGPPIPTGQTFDALNPNGLASRMSLSTTSSNTSSLLRAFAPSPAERQVLQRAFGGSTNNSLERLPSLSRVGSIPSSPSHVHAVPTRNPRPTSIHMEKGEFGRTLPSWLQSLPRIGKSNFSPWDDEEPSAATHRGEGSSESG